MNVIVTKKSYQQDFVHECCEYQNRKEKMSKNPHVTIVVVVLQYRFVEIEGEIAVAIFLHTNVQIEAMEYTNHCAVRFAMQWKE